MSMFYKSNLLNTFLFSLDRCKWTSPLCSCSVEEQTAIHVLTNCSLTEESLRNEAIYYLNIANDDLSFEELGCVAILNCSRDPGFIRTCRDILDNDQLLLRRKISIRKTTPNTRSTQAQLGSLASKLDGQCPIHWQHTAAPRPIINGQYLTG